MEPKYKPNDPELIENILAEVKRSGMFDQFRKDCISDVDTKPAYQNLQFKVENTVTKFLGSQKWSPDTNRNQLREKLRKNILETGYLDSGIERIVDQVLYPKMAGFQSQIEELVYSYLKIERPKRKVVKEEPVKEEISSESLLPKDLEAVSSPESYKNKGFGSQEDLDKVVEENDDDFESPAFELLEGVVVETGEKTHDDSHLSGLSNMTSEGSVKDESKQKDVGQSHTLIFESMESMKQEEDESRLSQVSSGSRLSIVVQSEKDSLSPKPEVLNITEEAQMPKFSENSNSIDAKVPEKETIEGQSVFDFKKEEIEFKGASRKQMTLDEKLKEEIYESENKHANIFKTDDIETNSHSSDMKLEIVEQNATESESALKIDFEMAGTSSKGCVKVDDVFLTKSEISENERKYDEKGQEKRSSVSEKKDRSNHHKSSKSSKHRDEKPSSSGKSSHSTSKSRHSDRDRHHSSSSRHKSSSSSKHRDRHSSSSAKVKEKGLSKDRHHRSRSDHKSKDHHVSRDKSDSVRHIPDEKNTEEHVKSQNLEEKSPQEILSQHSEEICKGIAEDIVNRKDLVVHLPFEAFSEPNPMAEYNDSPLDITSETSPVEPSHDFPLKHSCEVTPKYSAQTLRNMPTPKSLPNLSQPQYSADFMSDEDDFYGFPENEMLNTGIPNTEFLTPKKMLLQDAVTPISSSQKSVLNQSILDEDSFLGFDDGTPQKLSEKLHLSEVKQVKDEKPEESTGKRVRRPNTKYLNEEFATNDDEHDELLKLSNKKRKRPDSGKIIKKQKSEEKPEEADNDDKKLHESRTQAVTAQNTGPKTPESENPSETLAKSSSKKHSKHGSRSSSRHK